MLSFLFPRLTREPKRGAALFAALVGEARDPAWFRDAAVPDTLDGRFAVLATVAALIIVRLERGGDDAQGESVGVTERFIEAMDAEHRQMGISDPALGKTVRKLVGALAHRVDMWRAAVAGGDWSGATASSLYGGAAPGGGAIELAEALLRRLWQRVESAADARLIEGRLA